MPDNIEDPQFEILLEHVKRSRGFDFIGYKRPSLTRRVRKRMDEVGVKNYVDYVNFLEGHPNEFAELFNTILINVTSFFRDPEAWEYIEKTVIPEIAKRNLGELRVWCAGCASGEEAYSIAILFCEALGPQAFRERVKIYATDVDEHALMQARHATYASNDLEHVPFQFRETYFQKNNSQYTFRPDLRRSVIFGRHDLVQNAPISRLDLLVCRNTLMYMNADTQGRILTRLHFALKDKGYLFLGKAEMLTSRNDLFVPVDLKHRIFMKSSKAAPKERLLTGPNAADLRTSAMPISQIQLSQLSFDSSDVSQIIVDVAGRLRLANHQARRMLGINAEQIGSLLQDLDMGYYPVDLRSLALESLRDLRMVRLTKVPVKDRSQFLDVQAVPLVHDDGQAMGVIVFFLDSTNFHELCASLQLSHEELETTNEDLQATNEELETTNEELQSTNEELQTTNEELQATHEELETTNEELQSTHEELQATNGELTALTSEKESSNNFLESILASMPGGVIVLDEDFKVRAWNHESEEMWGMRSDEVKGHSFYDLDIGLPAGDLRDPLEEVLSNDLLHKTLHIDTINRRGKALPLNITITRIIGASNKCEGALLVMYRSQIDMD